MLDELKLGIQALRAKTNGSTEDEALSAAAKVAELLDRRVIVESASPEGK